MKPDINWTLRAAALATLFALPGIACGEPGELRHDPFARPQITSPQAQDARPASSAEAAEPAWRPQLRAVVAAGPDSMVNVEGTVVALGGQIDGFRLVAVEERRVVFSKDGVRVELAIGDRTDRKEAGRK